MYLLGRTQLRLEAGAASSLHHVLHLAHQAAALALAPIMVTVGNGVKD